MIIQPDYYDKFTCIADRCDFTCCQEWKIAVDETTNRKWKNMTPPAGTRGKRKNLSLYTTFKDGSRVIGLKNHVCPFLDERKLCRLVMAYGEEVLSETCHIFPREIHVFPDREERTLMPCCPAVIDLLNEAEEFRQVIMETGEQEAAAESAGRVPGETLPVPEESNSSETDREASEETGRLRRIRSLALQIAAEEDLSPEEVMMTVFFVLSQFQDQEDLTAAAVLQDLPEVKKAIRDLDFEPEELFTECNELFLDLVENYRKESMYVSLLNEAAEEAEQIEEAAEGGDPESYSPEFGRAWANYRPLLKKLLAEEFYSDLMIPGGDPESMIMKAEWIGMEYTMIRHLSYLKYRRSGSLDYQSLRNYIVLTCRMMGYEEEDIREYMENSFEDVIWDFGYMALIMGRL